MQHTRLTIHRATGGFRTDTEISGRDFSERELVPWLAPEEAGGMGGLEEDAGYNTIHVLASRRRHGHGEW